MLKWKSLLAFSVLFGFVLTAHLVAGPCWNLVIGPCKEAPAQSTCWLKCALGADQDCGIRVTTAYPVEVCTLDYYSEFSRCSELQLTEACYRTYHCQTSFEPCEGQPGYYHCYQDSPSATDVTWFQRGLDERFKEGCPVYRL